MTHRVFSQDGVMLDVLPFGISEGRADEIGWPPHFDHVMSTLGFSEALECSMKCQLKKTPPLHIRVASLAGIAVLKLIAWADSYPTRKRDAVDLRFILAHYDSGNIERLYSPEEHLFSDENADYDLVVAQLLGRDVGRSMYTKTRTVVLEILGRELDLDGDLRLLGDMLSGSDQRADAILELLESFRQGILDSSGNDG